MSKQPSDRRRPVNGSDHDLRTRMGGRVKVTTYTDVLNALLRRTSTDLAAVQAGRLSDTAREKEAREEVRGHLEAAREDLVRALGHIQHITDPRLRFTLGEVIVGPTLTKEGLVERAIDLVWKMHARGQWGSADTIERGQNEGAVAAGVGRIISRHKLDAHDVVIITEADRAATRVMVVERY